MSEKIIPDSTLDQVKRLSEERHVQCLKCKKSNLHLAILSPQSSSEALSE